jgi:hypothetical protein
LALAAVSLLTGCANYYRVTDPTTGKQYYTQYVAVHDGTTTLTDARTGDKVHIQNSDVREISKADFKAETGTVK